MNRHDAGPDSIVVHVRGRAATLALARLLWKDTAARVEVVSIDDDPPAAGTTAAPAALLVDWEPGVDTWLGGRPRPGCPPLIALFDAADPNGVEAARRCGVRACLVRPFSALELRQLLERHAMATPWWLPAHALRPADAVGTAP